MKRTLVHTLPGILFLMTIFACLFTSCHKGTDGPGNGIYSNGLFISNEGTFGKSNASVSFMNLKNDSVTPDIFTTTNNRPLGDVLQSICLSATKAYLVVNASDKVEVVNRDNFVQYGVINGLNTPRYMAISGNKGYITQWGENGVVKVVDLENNTIAATIKTGSGPEGILSLNGEIWVANSGGYNADSTISVINTGTGKVTNTIHVGKVPRHFVVDNTGNVWVLCSGAIYYNPDYSIKSQTASQLVKIDATSRQVLASLTISTTTHPEQLSIDTKNTLYYGGGFGFNGIYATQVETATSLPTIPLIAGSFYGFNIDPSTGNIYACVAPDFTSNGYIYKYSSSGSLIRKYTVGIGPNEVVFQ